MKTEKLTEKSTQLERSQALTERKKSKSNTIQCANVNSYKHFLSIPSANHPYIRWAVGLRNYEPPKTLTSSNSMPPETYYKTIESKKTKHTSADIQQNVNISEFQHLALHRPGVHASSGQLLFQTTLRRAGRSKELVDRERGWSNIPLKDRHEEPKFINSKSLKKKIIQPEQLEKATDGRQNFPRFTEKIIKNRNVNHFRHMIKGKVNLPTISWQANLRDY